LEGRKACTHGHLYEVVINLLDHPGYKPSLRAKNVNPIDEVLPKSVGRAD
jgi:hypothetical protein